MLNRFALVIGAQCEALPPLPFVPEVAQSVHETLTAGQAAGWRSVRDIDAPLLDASSAETRQAITDAFQRAHDDEAALALWFIGHGVATGEDDYYFMAKDSPDETPRSNNAVHLVQVLREELEAAPRIDGLVVVVDTCDGGEVARGSARRLVDKLWSAGGRLQFITASGDSPAYGACLSRTFTTMAARTVWNPVIPPEDLVFAARNNCTKQTPGWMGFDARTGPVADPDPSLWLKKNVAYRVDSVSGTSGEALLALSAPIADAVAHGRQFVQEQADAGLIWIKGSYGSGKSALLSSLYRETVSGPHSALEVPSERPFLDAFVALSGHESIDSLQDDIVEQLLAHAPRPRSAESGAAAGFWRVGLDGVDSMSPEFRVELERLISDAAASDAGTAVRFVITSSDDIPDALGDVHGATQLELTALGPTPDSPVMEFRRTEAGRGVQTALLAFADSDDTRAELFELLRSSLSSFTLDPGKSDLQWLASQVATAADPARPMPLSLGQRALRRRSILVNRRELHDALFELRKLIIRLPTAGGGEAVGLVHPALADLLGTALGSPVGQEMHAAVADELLAFRKAIIEGEPPTGEQALDSWDQYVGSLSYHLVRAGRFQEARSISWQTYNRTDGRRRRPMD
ncbi:hypothetical protein [Nocardioides okcheonensis]|uniref:hypothetical protein n=1 Tax=Nocardioides okcheonensis TaxID=2894081 RepID=UPI001E4DC8D4|nr:hypothetical protein [Nocardioides okcheonensis]UFN44553.1 hypothetical protein LN652_21340 [Nocardioides okcheonensis]